MDLLLKYTLLVEPDRQRLSGFVLFAVEKLGGNTFTASISLNKCMHKLYHKLQSDNNPVDICLLLDNKSLYVDTNTDRYPICGISKAPSTEIIATISTHLSQQSELADPELLRQRNARIKDDLEKAKARAAKEMYQLEKKLESRRIELELAQKNAETDGLTGLKNRGAYDVHLHTAIIRGQRQNEPLCLVMLDVDNFKQINDSNGHLFGDEYLKKVARSMREASRTDVDHCCRTGGDEFALIIYSDLLISERIAKTILKIMENKVSIGIAQMLPDDTPTTLAERCDCALYEAKENGRGQFFSSRITSISPEQRSHKL